MTINTKIVGGYSVVLALLLVLAIGSYWFFGAMQRQYGAIIALHEDLVEPAKDLQILHRQIVADYRAIFLYPHQVDRFLEDLRARSREFDGGLDSMHDTVPGEGRRMIEEIESIQAKRIQALEKAVSLVRGGKRLEAVAMGETEIMNLRTMLVDKIEAFREWVEKEKSARKAAISEAISRTFLLLGGALAAALLFGSVFSYTLARSITRQLRESMSRLSSASAEILSTTTQAASAAGETVAAVAETNTTVEELKQASHLSAQKAKNVSETAQQSSHVSQEGSRSVEETSGRIRSMQEQMGSISECILKLSEQSQQIGEIMSTVNDLAEQSNLLAVNAAIEAAKAGDQGKGFAVVAQEVRNLAEQSKHATTQVRSILNDVQKATSAAVMATEQGTRSVETGLAQAVEAGESIRALARNIAEASQSAIQISASSQQQLAGIEQIAVAMENIRVATEQNAAGVRQVEQAAQSLNELGMTIRAMVDSRKA